MAPNRPPIADHVVLTRPSSITSAATSSTQGEWEVALGERGARGAAQESRRGAGAALSAPDEARGASARQRAAGQGRDRRGLRPLHEKADLVKANLVAHSVVLLPLRHGLASIRTVTGRLSVTPCMLESV